MKTENNQTKHPLIHHVSNTNPFYYIQTPIDKEILSITRQKFLLGVYIIQYSNRLKQKKVKGLKRQSYFTGTKWYLNYTLINLLKGKI